MVLAEVATISAIVLIHSQRVVGGGPEIGTVNRSAGQCGS
jgi:hypothetical protein